MYMRALTKDLALIAGSMLVVASLGFVAIGAVGGRQRSAEDVVLARTDMVAGDHSIRLCYRAESGSAAYDLEARSVTRPCPEGGTVMYDGLARFDTNHLDSPVTKAYVFLRDRFAPPAPGASEDIVTRPSEWAWRLRQAGERALHDCTARWKNGEGPERQESVLAQGILEQWARAEHGSPGVAGRRDTTPVKSGDDTGARLEGVDRDVEVIGQFQRALRDKGVDFATACAEGRFCANGIESITRVRNRIVAEHRADPASVAAWFPGATAESLRLEDAHHKPCPLVVLPP